MEMGHLLTRSGLTCPEASSKIPSVSRGVCPAFFCETCQWLKFPLNGLRAQSRLSLVVGLLPLASEQACFGIAFPPFLVKQLYRCASVVITVKRWGWLFGRIRSSFALHYPLYPVAYFNHTKLRRQSFTVLDTVLVKCSQVLKSGAHCSELNNSVTTCCSADAHTEVFGVECLRLMRSNLYRSTCVIPLAGVSHGEI
jgi:hypothetical protein